DVRPKLVEQAAMVGVPGGDAEPLGGGLGQGGREVADAHDLDFRQGAEAAQVLTSDLAGSDQGGFDHGSVCGEGRGMIRAGSPPATAPGGTSRSTTLSAPTFAPRPIRTPPSTWA